MLLWLEVSVFLSNKIVDYGTQDILTWIGVVGLRKADSIIPFFERIVNAVHKELPDAKFAFNNNIEKTKEAVDRVVNGEE